MCFDQNWNFINNISYAEVVKLVDTSDSKSDDREVVGVRVPLSAPITIECWGNLKKILRKKIQNVQ